MTSSNCNIDNYIGPDELIYNSDAPNGIYSGGFTVNSIMMKKNLSPIITFNNNDNNEKIGGMRNVSDLFDNLVVPNWALSYNYKKGGMSITETDHDDTIEEDLHDKLINLVKVREDELREKNKTKHENNDKKYTKKTIMRKLNKKSKKRFAYTR
jgi:hypothetical protein